MNSKTITLLLIGAALIGVILTLAFIGTNKEEQKGDVDNNIELSEELVNQNVVEENSAQEEETKSVESQEEKISPNCLLILKKHYNGCKHTINEYVEMPPECINYTQNDMKKEYSDWEVEKFSPNEVVLAKEEEGECGEHYILRESNGKIVVYQIDANNEEKILEETNIATEYLTEEDKANIKNGFKVNTREELNKVLEDFE